MKADSTPRVFEKGQMYRNEYTLDIVTISKVLKSGNAIGKSRVGNFFIQKNAVGKYWKRVAVVTTREK